MKFPFQRRDNRRSINIDELADQLIQYGNLYYPFGSGASLEQTQESIESSFGGYAEAFKRNGVIAACMDVRMKVFSEARFQYRQLRNGRPGDLFGTAALAPLEKPWPGAATPDLLKRMIQDADLAGNFYATTYQRRIVRLRPDWVTIVLGSPNPNAVPGDLSWTLVGYAYQPGGPSSGNDIIPLGPDEVAHFAPIPDPLASYRGMSPMTPIIRDILGDNAMSTHKSRFFEKGATPNMIVSFDPTVNVGAMKDFVDNFKLEHEGSINAYKTLFLGGGADAQVVGNSLQQIDFRAIQGAGETRIAAAFGTPPVIVGLSEGLDAATYSNYAQARRRFADGTLRPLWRDAAASLEPLVVVPSAAQLWFDARDIAFLREDEGDQSDIQQTRAITIKQLVEAGFTPDSVVKAVEADDFSILEHTGKFSVQLQAPGAGESADAPKDGSPSTNGKVPDPAPVA